MDSFMLINGLVNKEIELLIPFIKEPWKEFTLSEIKQITGIKSHHYAYDGMKKFSESGLIETEKKGNTNIYKLSYENEDYDLFILAENLIKEKNTQIPSEVLRKITDKIKEKFYILLVTGSYALGKQTKKSDLDIAIIIPDNSEKKHFDIALKEGELTIPEVHGHVFTETEFYKMLVNKEYNYGKECAKNHILIYGVENYYKILMEALENGFKIKDVPKKSKKRNIHSRATSKNLKK